jgi:hypothetical protein
MNSDCQSVRDTIADVVSGLLPVSEIEGLQEHLDSCEACRGYMQRLQEEETSLADYFVRMDSQNAGRQERVLRALETSQTHKQVTIISLWRAIMTNRYSRFGAVAAMLAIAAAFVVFLDKSTTTAYAITDVSTAYDQAHVIHIKGWQYFPGQAQNDGNPIPPLAIDTWIDLANGRSKQMNVSVMHSGRVSSSGAAGNNTTVTSTETIRNGAYMMTLDHAAKTASFARVTDYYRQWTAYWQSRQLWGQLCGQPDQLTDFTKVGQEAADGAAYDIWQLDTTHTFGGGPQMQTPAFGGSSLSYSTSSGGGMAGGGGGTGKGVSSVSSNIPTIPSVSTRTKLWLSASTGQLSRAQTFSRIQDGSWQLDRDYQTIEYDVQASPDVFSTDVPQGYLAMNSKETAPPVEWKRSGTGIGVNGNQIEYRVFVNFTLADGSVIVGWQSSESNPARPQESPFGNLTFGGDLPKLPIEFYGLKPAGTSNGPTFTGYHLGLTRKADQFVEWSVYVPDTTPPSSVQGSGYAALYRFNIDPAPNAAMGLNLDYGVPVRTADEFNAWVRNGMAEFSDDATAPADVTYEKVTALARQVRANAKP